MSSPLSALERQINKGDPILSIMIDNLPFSEWLTAQLDARGWSMRELGRRAGVSHATVSNVIGGQVPTWDFCAAIAEPLGMTPPMVFLIAGKLSANELLGAIRALPQGRVGASRQLAAVIEGLSGEEQKALLTLFGARAKAAPINEEDRAAQERRALVEEGLRALDENPALLEEFERVIRAQSGEGRAEDDQAGRTQRTTKRAAP